MIKKDNFKELLRYLKFKEKNNIFYKNFKQPGVYLKADFKKKILEYPELIGLIINERQTCNFDAAENAVVFECVNKLLEKGYKPKHIELEPKWKIGHGASGGRADILVKDQNNKPILIIECKTYGKEFYKAWKDTKEDGGQLFSYAQQIAETKFLCLYASEFDKKNKQIITEQRIISHKDNDKILEQNENLKSFRNATNVKKRFNVWTETYQQEYTETGIFENNIQAYQIGKNNYSLEIDTRPVTDKDKNGKYHRFRTILRQHNIARRETAFEVLVNLFLAKIVDEEENKNKLEFYWKGIAYDNYYDFIDRLQKLYQVGMRKFLKDEVMYISSEQIDNAFWTVKNKKNATKKQIQKYFRDLKFFSNNAFSLINVHNERLFNRNTKVIVEIVQMWQNLRLKTKKQNQFLGDMFEFFLDNSIKQSEGQFFTPMPITKFIVAALPLEYKIKNSKEPLKAIDYACGAGHFLNEYANQIKKLVEKYKNTEISKYYENIIGIEKEDRLAKIAKVSAYMYGQDQIKILEKDALSNIDEIKPESFDVLVANPPFAVEGFLMNLDQKQKKNYKLIKTIKNNSNTNNIQCFFIERAKQIMSPNGVVGIIVPSSILSNSDATHIGTREIIIKFFDIIAIVELGSGTFGKTGTNTVVLFLKRKCERPEQEEHYANRAEDYFEENLREQLIGNKPLNRDILEYQDLDLIKEYCKHIKIEFDEYIKIFGITDEDMDKLEKLLKYDIFVEYKKNFEKSNEVKNLKKKIYFKKKNKVEKKKILDENFIEYIYAIEKEKLFYFILAHENKQKVLIVKSPKNNKIQKKFLGYQWSGAKGKEGIKYIDGNGLNDIITPLFNPKNTNDKTKINYLIQQNFIGAKQNDLKDFQQYKDLVSYVNVTDILDFSRKDFNKNFLLSPKKNINIDTKWELVKLGEVVETLNGLWIGKKEPFVKVTVIRNTNFTKGGKFDLSDVAVLEVEKKQYEKRKLKYGDIVIEKSGGSDTQAIGRVIFFNKKEGEYSYSNFTSRLRLISNNIKSEYLYLYLNYFYELGFTFDFQKGMSGIKNLDFEQYLSIKIPLPPKSVQEQIVNECEVIDKASEKAQKIIDKTNANIYNEIKEFKKNNWEKSTIENLEIDILGNLSKIPKKEILENGKYPVITQESNKLISGYTNESFVITDLPLIVFGDHTCIFKYIDFPFVRGADGTKLLKVDSKKIIPKYFYFIIKQTQITNKDRYERHYKYIKDLKIPVPPLSEQKILVSKIEDLENIIIKSQGIISISSAKKQSIMDNYLK